MFTIKDLPTGSPQRIFVDLKPTEASNVTINPRGISPVNIAATIEIDKPFFALRYASDVVLKVESIEDQGEFLKIDPLRLLTVTIGDGEPKRLAPGRPVGAHLTAKETPITLSVYPGAITDCTEQNAQGKYFPLIVNLELTRGKESVKAQIELGITFMRDLRRPDVTIECVTSAPYTQSGGLRDIGRLLIRNLGSTLFEPAVDCRCAFTVTANGRPVPSEAIYADFLGALGGMAEPTGPGQVLIRGLQTSARREQGLSTAEVPIYIDFSKIPNPCDCPSRRLDYSLRIAVEAYNPSLPGKKQTNSDSAALAILPNDKEIDLRVKVRDRFDDMTSATPVTGGLVPLKRVDFQPGAAFRKIFYISLSNTATRSVAPKTGISIRNIQIEPRLPGNCRVEYSDSSQEFISLSGDASEIFLPSAPDSSHDLKLELSFSKIRDLYVQTAAGKRLYDVTIPVRLTFDYYIDKAGDHDVPGIFEEQARQFECTFKVAAHQLPPKEWLAIDFGTSAIVSQYGGELIDLHKVKSSLFTDSATDTYEKGTPFLSSNLILRQNAGRTDLSQLSTDTPNAESFDQMALCLSPTSDTEQANIRTTLPYLKLIVGYDLLPNIQNYANFAYNAIDPADGQVRRMALQERGEGGAAVNTPLARVDKIFEEVYRQLFRYYITTALNAGEEATRMNQIVLTIPNTYTPEHVRRIERIVRDAFRHVHLRNVRFVSESDAVACFYQSNWAKINAPHKRDTNAALLAKERVLVYDMGAGTLDLTLFTRTVANDSPHVNVFGKMGIAKAGNYLDCLLARILSKKAPSLANLTDPAKIGNDADRLIRAFELKDYVKNELKPRLSGDDKQLTLKRNLNWGLRENVVYDIKKDILQDPDFMAYVDACTKGLIGNFFRFYSNKAAAIGERDMKIDTVLLSGRSTKLKPLRQAIEKALADYGAPGMKIVEISSVTDPGDKFDKAKTVVTEGALDYVTKYARDNDEAFESDSITACYGIIYRNTAGEEKYLEIFNPHVTGPTAVKQYNGLTVKTYSSPEHVVNLKNSSSVTLVQTYLVTGRDPSDPTRIVSATEDEWRKGNREYITVMSEFSTSAFPNPEQTHISIIVNDRNELILRVNGLESEPNVPTKIDINSESNIMSLWPMMSAPAQQ